MKSFSTLDALQTQVMHAPADRRRFLFVPVLPRRTLALIVGASAGLATSAVWATLLLVWSPVADKLVYAGTPPPTAELFMDFCLRIGLTTLAVGGCFALVSFGAVMTLAKRLAGPLDRIGRVALRVAMGDLSERIHVRRGDLIHDFADQLNRMLDSVEGRLRRREAALRRIQSRLADIEYELRQGNMSQTELQAQVSQAQSIIQDVQAREAANS